MPHIPRLSICPYILQCFDDRLAGPFEESDGLTPTLVTFLKRFAWPDTEVKWVREAPV